MKADFFASMSHELRTPLTSIKEGTGLLLDGVGGETTDKQHKLLTILAEESNRLINVVNSLLDLSKMEAGMMTYDFELGNVDPLIRRALAEMTPLIEAKQIRLESKVRRALAAGQNRSGTDFTGFAESARQRREVHSQRRPGQRPRQTRQWQVGSFCERLRSGYPSRELDIDLRKV